MSEIKVGSRVEFIGDHPYVERGTTGTVLAIRHNQADVYFDNGLVHPVYDRKVGGKSVIAILYPDITLKLEEEDEEPDLYLYPDTPKGTKIVAIQDTVSAFEVEIPKGTVLTLSAMLYTCGGTHIAAHGLDVPSWYGILVNVEHFMIVGNQDEA